MPEILINPKWPFACRGAIPVGANEQTGTLPDYQYDPRLQLNISIASGEPIVTEPRMVSSHSTTAKTAVDKEGDQPDCHSAPPVPTYTSYLTRADKEGDQPDPNEGGCARVQFPSILAATSLQTEVSKEQDRPD